MSDLKLFIIDENSGVRRALAGRLGSSPRLCITGTAGNLREGLRLALQLKADVILVDAKTIRTPLAASGLRAVRRAGNDQSAQIIVLTAVSDETERRAAELAGAGRYLLKDIDSQALIREIESIGSGAPTI